MLRRCQDEDRKGPARLGLRKFKTMSSFMDLVNPEIHLQAAEGGIGHQEEETANAEDS